MARKSVPAPQEGRMLHFLYHTVPGRMLLKPLTGRAVSKLVGGVLDLRISRGFIPHFIKKNHIPMSQYTNEEYTCFNDCFTRKIRPEYRRICMDADALIAPCDGLLSVYPIKKNSVIPVKQSRYTVSELLGHAAVAEEFTDGVCLVFRLCVNHYHRYCYLDSGTKGANHFVEGKLHTVRPIALEETPVFTENCREYTILDTDHFGTVAQIEVGAMLVGRIKNHHGSWQYERGEEKGMFLYGGSTIVVLLQKNRVKIPSYAYEATARGEEIPVHMGEKIGHCNAP